MSLAVLALAAAAPLAAQFPVPSGEPRPQLVWEGEVDGTSILYVRGGAVDIEDKGGLPVQRQRFRFYERLPERRTDVEVRVRQGRGRVLIAEQPRPENSYTLAVRIEDRQAGSSYYSVEFFWQASPSPFRFPESGRSSSERGESLTWSGRVDDEAVVECRDDFCEARASRGLAVTRERYRFSSRLPEQNVIVSLEQVDGRGEVRLVQHPREENGYTARVLIRDSQGGAGDYSFTLTWSRPSRQDFSYARRGLLWSGRVDGRIRVIVEGQSAWSEVVSGGPVEGERATFDRPLAPRANSSVTVRRLRGRGRVEIVEYPTARNNFRIVFEIEDGRGGSDHYDVEVGW